MEAVKAFEVKITGVADALGTQVVGRKGRTESRLRGDLGLFAVVIALTIPESARSGSAESGGQLIHSFPVRPLDISLGGECLLAPCTVVASAGSSLLSSWKNLRQCGQNASFFTLALHRAHCFWVIPDTPAPAILLEIGAMVFFIARATVSRLRDCPRSWVLPFRSA